MNLVIGASGQVGSHLMKALPPGTVGTYYQHAAPGLRHLDITKYGDVHDLIIETEPDVIYLAAGNVHADYCEEHIIETDSVNILGVLSVVQIAMFLRVIKGFPSKLVFFSSDYLFDGEAGLYSEINEPHPLNVYGRQKQIAEMLISHECQNHLIIRTCGVFSWEPQGKNFVQRLVKSLRAEQSVRVPNDQYGTPTYAPDLAKTTIELVNQGATGIYNITGSDLISRYDFARNIADIFDLDMKLIEPVSTDELGQSAQRPRRGGLIVYKAKNCLRHPLEHWLSGLQRMAKAEVISV